MRARTVTVKQSTWHTIDVPFFGVFIIPNKGTSHPPFLPWLRLNCLRKKRIKSKEARKFPYSRSGN
jgi:hypothetical protein